MYSVRHPARRYDREYIAYPISVFSLCVACSICRCGSGWKHGGFCFFSFPAVSMISCPLPPVPLPGGKGESQSLFRRGGFAPGTPALNRLRHMQTLPYRCPAGGLPGRSAARPAFSFDSAPIPPPPFPSGRRSLKVYFAGGLRPRHPCTEPSTALTDAAVREPGGGLPSRSPTRPALSFIGCPHPPAPLPVGKGAFSFLMQGASPLASPRPSRKRHGLHLRCGCPAGGLPGRSPARPALNFIGCPHPPPPPFPSGRGLLVFLCKGLRPLHPRGLNPWFAANPTGSNSLRVVPPGFSLRAPQRQSL